MWINSRSVTPDSHHQMPENSEFADFINKVMREVPEELTSFRIHAAKLLLAAILLRVGLPQERLGEMLSGFSLRSLAADYSRLLDCNRTSRWFLNAVDHYEDEVRSLMPGQFSEKEGPRTAA